MRYCAFLSYSHADRKWARWLHRALESYRLPKQATSESGQSARRRLSPIFRDRDELPSTASLSAAVNEALKNSDKLILICSPAAAASRWVNEEVRAFRRLGKADDILCLIVDGEPGAGDSTECFPEALTEAEGLDERASEPVAADARPHGDGRHNALLKIIAGILGVGFDVLRRRDLRRRHRRMLAITAASLVISLLTITLAVTATIAREEAEFRRTQAEDLVDFMLGDLMERLREIGRLDIYETISDEALRYFAEQRDADVSERTLAQRAKNLRQIGEVRMDQNDLDSALAAFEESLLVTKRLATVDNSNTEAQVGLAVSHFYVGHVHWMRGDIGAAQSQFERQLDIVKQLSESEPENTRWLMELGYAYTNLGRVLELTGKLQQAKSAYLNVMLANERLIELQPDSDDWHAEVGFAHNNLGKLLIALGHLDEAESHYRQDLEIKARLRDENPNHNIRRRDLAVSQYYLGQLLLDRGELTESETQIQAALENFKALLAIDTGRSSWQWRHANAQRELGRLYTDTERSEQALAYLESSTTVLRELLQEDPGNTGWQRDLVRSMIAAAYAEAAGGRKEEAYKSMESARNQIVELHAKEPNVRDTHELLIRAEIGSAELAVADSEDAASHSRRAMKRLEDLFPNSHDPRILELRARSLELLGLTKESARIREHLKSIGFGV